MRFARNTALSESHENKASTIPESSKQRVATDGSQKLFIARAINEHHIAETREDGGGRPWQVGPHVTVLLPPLDVREGYGRGVGEGVARVRGW